MSEKKISREPPNSEESEIALLGSILLRPTSIERVIDILRPGDFYRSAHRLVYEAMLDLYEKRDAIDMVILADRLEKLGRFDQVGGMEFLMTLQGAVPTSYNIVNYANIIANKAILRNLQEAAWEIVESTYSSTAEVRDVVDEAERMVFEVGQRDLKTTLRPIDEIIRENIEAINEHLKTGNMFSGIPTGYEQLDELISGFQAGQLIVIAARPSMGKSAFALNLAENICLRDGIPVVVFTLEMNTDLCGMRILASNARVSLRSLMARESDDEDFRRLTKSAGELSEIPLYIDDSANIGTDEVRAKCRRLKAEKGLGLVIIDYIQLMKTRRGIESREQQISDISRNLKALAKELKVPVIALSQLNRKVEERKDRRPMLSDIRESGAVEQDADLITFIYRHEYYFPEETEEEGKAEIIVAKNRNGPTGTAKLSFVKRFMRFENLAQYQDEPY